jgi:hypothetical protein
VGWGGVRGWLGGWVDGASNLPGEPEGVSQNEMMSIYTYVLHDLRSSSRSGDNRQRQAQPRAGPTGSVSHCSHH